MNDLKSRRKRRTALQTMFSVFFALYPILCIYKAFFRFTIGDIFLMFFLALGMINPPRQDSRIIPAVIFLSYTSLFFAANLFGHVMDNSLAATYFFRLAKLIFYFLSAYVCGKKYFDIYVFKKTVMAVGLCTAAFIVFQYVAYYSMGRIVLGRIPFLQVYEEDYIIDNYQDLLDRTFRPSSLMLEPATLCQYMVVPLVYTLYSNSMRGKRKFLLSAIFIVTMVLSTSGQGVLYIAVILVLYTFTGVKRKRYAVGILIVAVTAAVFMYFAVEPFRFAADRLLYGTDALNARIGSYKYLDMDTVGFIFGKGYGSLPYDEYFAGAAYVWYGCGVVGVALVTLLFGWLFVKAPGRKARMLCVLFFVMFWATSLFYSNMLFWYITLILFSRESRGKRIRYDEE